ncbi:MAG TPA: sigma-70 family RNA polymerase sigma factor [Kofleriaceae bacterium]|nr:sigma-70 family RNA polymerase sigma factor [Kofleriaceae bacterium]
MNDADSPLADLGAAHTRFLALVQDVRPELHRYCARMVGSVMDGEDVVQETLARAYYELSQLRELPALRAWLFRIAHHKAIDHLRRRERARELPLDDDQELASGEPDPAEELSRGQAVRVAVSRFVSLPPAQRAAVILKDVLGASLEEIAATLDTTIPAVKAALHRGRDRLRRLEVELAAEDAPAALPAHGPALVRYAALFNARDWAAVRAMLVEDVRLDLVSRERRTGVERVGSYLTNYGRVGGWYLTPMWLDGREVIGVGRDPTDRTRYVIELEIADGCVISIRDYRYVPYLLDDLAG